MVKGEKDTFRLLFLHKRNGKSTKGNNDSDRENKSIILVSYEMLAWENDKTMQKRIPEVDYD